MKALKILLLAILSLIFFNCKKGKEDPFISFKSRDKMIVGTWKLTSGEVTYMVNPLKQVNSYTENEVTISGDYIYNTNMTTPNSLFIKILGSGQTEYDYINSSGKNVWHWNNNRKNKSGIYLGMPWFIIGDCDFNFTITKLTNNEMKLYYQAVSSVTVNNVRSYGTTVELQFKKTVK